VKLLQSFLVVGALLSFSSWSAAAEACGGAQCICRDMRAFDALDSDPADFSRLEFGYAVHDLKTGLDNFISELNVWAGAGNSAVARATRELRVEVDTLRDCFCGIPSHAFLMRAVRGLDTFYQQLQRNYAGDMLINRNEQLQVRMARIETAYGTLIGYSNP
jgi:hypothetical protein